MSPIDDPDSPKARRLTRLAARMKTENKEPGATAPRRAGRVEPVADRPERPLLQAADALDADWDELPKREKHGRRGAAARKRAPAAPLVARALEPAAGGVEPWTAEALVVATTRGPCEVELADGSRLVAHLPKALARADHSEIAVGDRVQLVRRPAGELVVAQVLPRTSRLSRPDPLHAHRERVLAANLDLAIVVASLRDPPLSTGLVDRFLVALRHGGIEAALAVNKIDLASRPDADRLAVLEPYERFGLRVALCSARTGEGIERLRGWISGRTVAFVGHSGVGKSSLLNALAPEAAAAVGETSKAQRGRHTTTGARVYRLADGTRIVDTPGIREFGLWRLTPGELAGYFDEFEPFAPHCRFSDCSHRHEPGCAVRDAVRREAIAPERFATYLRILDSLERA